MLINSHLHLPHTVRDPEQFVETSVTHESFVIFPYQKESTRLDYTTHVLFESFRGVVFGNM